MVRLLRFGNGVAMESAGWRSGESAAWSGAAEFCFMLQNSAVRGILTPSFMLQNGMFRPSLLLFGRG